MKKITKNEGKLDRLIRLMLASYAIFWSVYLENENLQILFWVIAVILTITALTGFCGVYKLFGISTCPVEKK